MQIVEILVINTLNPKPSTLSLKSYENLNPRPQIQSEKTNPQNPKPHTLNSKP